MPHTPRPRQASRTPATRIGLPPQTPLNGLGETTTAADLVRSQGQSRRLRVITPEQLQEWIEQLLRQQFAGKAGALSDTEKLTLLTSTQQELGRRMQRAQALERENDQMCHAMDGMLTRLSHGGRADERERLASELKRTVAEQAERIRTLHHDIDLLRDEMRERSLLLATTLTEKEQVKRRVGHLEQQAGMLIASLRQLDADCYQGQHQHEHPDPGESTPGHGLVVGALIAGTLSRDLARLQTAGRQKLDAGAEDLPQLLAVVESVLEAGRALDEMLPGIGDLLETLSDAHAILSTYEDADGTDPKANDQPKRQSTRLMPGSNASEQIAIATLQVRRMANEWREHMDRAQALQRALRDARRAQHERGHALIQSRQDAVALRTELEETRAKLAKAEADIARLGEERESAVTVAQNLGQRLARLNTGGRRADPSPSPGRSR